MNKHVAAIALRFKSNNSVPVERAVITKGEWEYILDLLSPATEQPEVAIKSSPVGREDAVVSAAMNKNTAKPPKKFWPHKDRCENCGGYDDSKGDCSCAPF